jgi:two-component system, NtrC family, sensor kinase
MGTCQCKLEELDKASELKAEVAKLNSPGLDLPFAYPQLPRIRTALKEYLDKLNETVERRPAPNSGHGEHALVESIEKDLRDIEELLDREKNTPVANAIAGNTDLLERNPALRKKFTAIERNANDLIDLITGEIKTRVETTRKEARKSIMLLISTSVMAVILMVGLLRFFYRWVAQPIRELEEGVSRVARGDFQNRLDIQSGDEIEDLARAFNEMTDKLSAMYENLAQQVNERSRQLVRSEQLAGVGFLAAGVAHEINNPLAAILFSSEALESRLSDLLRSATLTGPDRDTIAKYLKMIQEEAFRCKEITQKLLAFSRGGEHKREETNLAELIRGVLDVVQHLQSCKGKRIDFQPGNALLAWVNSQEIKQVFLNLVVNALENMEEGGVLAITHAMSEGRIELTFKDTGCGMTPDVLDNIFQPFFTRSRTGKGTGLGLSISHRIITQHGGEIEATSDGPGKGSTFTIRLPIQPAANAAEPGQDVRDPVEEFLKLSSARRKAA